MATVGDLTAVESDLCSLLAGRSPLKTAHCLHDLTSKRPDEFRAVTKRSVCYIVVGIIINDAGDVLFMQEAKASCRGKWYLPAGRMEPNETIVEGAKREVLEETGLEFEPDTLLCVEAGVWTRFTFIGHVTGGKLKTLAESDGESLQARWMSKADLSNSKAYPLRASDVVRLIMLAQNYRLRLPDVRHPPLLPVISGHQQLLIRLVITHRSGVGDVSILMDTRAGPHFPFTVLNPRRHRSIKDCFFQVLKQAFGTKTDSDLDVLGLLSIEHHGKPEAVNDGFAMTFLISFPNKGVMPEIGHGAEETYLWHTLAESELKDNLMKRLTPGMCVPIL